MPTRNAIPFIFAATAFHIVFLHCESLAIAMDNTSHVVDEIDHAVSELKVQKWTAMLPFNGCLCLSTDDVVMASFQDCHDLFSLTSTLHKGFILRFDPQMFPVVPGGVAKNKDSIKKLFDVLISIDKTRQQKQWQENCANRRWSVTERIPVVPKASLSQSEQAQAKQQPWKTPMSANHNIGPGKTAAMVEEEFGLHLTRRQVAQMQQMAKLADDLTSTDELEEYKHLDSDTDLVLAYLEKKGQLIWTERMEYIGNQGCVQFEVLPEEEVFAGDLYKYASERRRALLASYEQQVLISLVWAMPVGRRCIQAFPELLFSDATHKTNQENRPLITFGVKDTEGRVQVVIRAWAPNERAWMFRWLFQTAVPAIIGKTTCEQIRLVITDGDSQELTQLDDAISSVFTKCVCRRCGWHIIHQGWKRHVGSLGRSQEAKEISQRIRSWVYFFMKSIETLDEYQASKALLLSYVNSEEVVKVIGNNNTDHIVTFLHSNVFVHEQHFARCFYLDVRGFDAYSNTCLEGTNYGVKYCENRVLPNMSQAKATKVMINQDEDKFTQNRKKTCDAFHKNALQGRTKTSAHVLQTAERASAARLSTYFESFTHHSVDIRFWTVYSLYAVVLDPSELNEHEIKIRNKLVTARWKSPQPPTAPSSMKSMDEGRFSVGSKSQDQFKSMTSEDLLLYFEALMKNKLSILNYNIEHVEKAVAVMEKHHGNAVAGNAQL
ncbi:MULE transposase domain containing protein [Nitzschia inconspicua]|uniref:MULE transposase domain containing protein n=1 Tax=Nitzschia inconspicua TaxID=303405 RepID=A0A9K3LG32_9STRA|nr:MULE transposase domain containing protein [Nitzschia inconspicua]